MILLAVSVYAQFDAEKGFGWLASKSTNGNYGDFQGTAIAGLAFRNSGSGLHATAALRYTKDQQDPTQYCWPKGTCRVKDTIFAMLLAGVSGDSLDHVEIWLKNAQTTALIQGNWWLQVATDSSGVCKVNYEKDGKPVSRNLVVNKGVFPTCNNQTFFDVNNCFEPSLLKANPTLVLDVDCKDLGSSLISLVYNLGNSYYLMQEATANGKITVSGGCYGVTSKASCDIETSLYASWILKEVGSDINILPWVEANYDTNKPLHVALLTLATKSKIYGDELVKLQKADGSFSSSIYDTAISMIALKEVNLLENYEKARLWLEKKQGPDGSFGGNVLNTAASLYALTYGEEIAVELPGCVVNGVKDGAEEGLDCGSLCPISCEGASECGDGVCSMDEKLSGSCDKDCVTQATCDRNGKCDTDFFENSQNCPQDCSCGDEICDNLESSDQSCAQDCGAVGAKCGNDIVETGEDCDGTEDSACPGECSETCSCPVKEESKSRWWLWLLILIILGVVGWYFYNKKKSGKGPGKPEEGKGVFSFFKKKPESKKPEFKPFTSRLPEQKPLQKIFVQKPMLRKQEKTRVEDELEKSLREAKKLLGK